MEKSEYCGGRPCGIWWKRVNIVGEDPVESGGKE